MKDFPCTWRRLGKYLRMKRKPDEFKTCVVCSSTFSRRKKCGNIIHAPRWALKVTCCNRCHLLNMWAKRKENVSERFWRQVEIRGDNDCWIWVGGYRDPKKGYGGFHLEGRKMMRSHRMAYILMYGEISDDLVVRHKCDNAPCCNPAHLEAGTVGDNNHDRDTRGRHVAFTRDNHPGAKLSVQQMQEMKATYDTFPRGPKGRVKNGYVRPLAEKYGIAVTTLCTLMKD